MVIFNVARRIFGVVQRTQASGWPSGQDRIDYSAYGPAQLGMVSRRVGRALKVAKRLDVQSG